MQELLKAGGLNPGVQTDLKRVLRELVKDGSLLRDGKRFRPADAPKPKQKSGPAWQGKPPKKAAPPPKQNQKDKEKGPPKTRSTRGETVTGIIHHHRDGFAFVKPVVGQESEDLFIPPDEAKKALDNDQVVVEVLPGRDGRKMGRVVEVKSRTRQLVVGTYNESAKGAWVTPREAELGEIRVPKTQLARPGDAVKVRLGVGGSMFEGPSRLTGEVAGSLGSNDDHSVEVLSVAFSKGFHDEFPGEVMDEADAISLEVSEKDAKGEKRRDLRKMALITIDGEDARDFDDAVYCEAHDRGTRLVVAIADVSHYVTEGSALDEEGLRRATSVYLPGRVLPMLPERLSNGICSLKPDVDRLCMVADMVIDSRGQTIDSEIYPAVMRSAARCTYTEVHQVLNGEDVPHRNAFKPQFERLMSLARTLTKMRLERGAIDFDLPEQKVELGDDGLPVKLVKRERWESHRLVEECMLAANECVARFFREQNLPTVNRYHGPPDEDRLDMFLTLLGAYGITPPPGEFTSASLNAVLKELEGHAEQRALNQLALRSMMQAVYSSKHTGHYGLGAEDYLHFTSPIRRYPDLLVHRLLKALWKRGKKKLSDDQLEVESDRLEALGVQCSERERAAMQVEREVNQLYSCLLLKDRVGEEHPGTVAGLTENGFFVQLDELWVEGFVKGETLFPDFEFEQATYRITYGNGLTVKVGAKCRVMILSVNMQRKQIDFQVQELEGAEVEAHEPEVRQERPRFGGGGRDRGQQKQWRSQDRGGRYGPPKKEDRGGGRRFGGSSQRDDRPRHDDRGGKRFGGGSTQREEKPRHEQQSGPRSKFGGSSERDDRGSTKRFGRMEPRSNNDRSERPQKGNFDRFASSSSASRRDKPRREQPPPQPWDKKPDAPEEEQSAGVAESSGPRKFDARAVLDRLWRERGGGGKKR
ncbi:MAG: ribonuclease R [Archangium sp.]